MMEVEDMCLRALRGKEKTRGPEHTSTLKTVDILGNLYAEQSKKLGAEEMHMRALQEEKALDSSTNRSWK